jgi:hypothetical protein
MPAVDHYTADSVAARANRAVLEEHLRLEIAGDLESIIATMVDEPYPLRRHQASRRARLLRYGGAAPPARGRGRGLMALRAFSPSPGRASSKGLKHPDWLASD